MVVRIGPSGLGGKNEAISILEEYYKNKIDACEIAFTYGVYLDVESAKKISEVARKLNIFLSIHAPYYVNLNSKDMKKIEASKKRILDCCEIGHYLSNSNHKVPIVFHAGFYSGMDSDRAFCNIKKEILELLEEIKKKKWNVDICPEIMGKRNVFGSIDEISRLVKETGCGCCIDFAHVLARYDSSNFSLIEKEFGKLDHWHCHFSGIEYGDKGEKNHKQTKTSEWKNLFDFLKKFSDKEIVIISEAPNPVTDVVDAKNILNSE